MKDVRDGYAVIRIKFSKGDAYDESTVGIFEHFEEAEAEMLSRMAGRDHGVRWPDWEEYEVHAFMDGRDLGTIVKP